MFSKTGYLTLGLTLLLAACGPAGSNPMMVEADPTASVPAMDVPMAGSVTPGTNESSMAPAWLGTMFTDVRAGQEFTVTGYAGQVVLVEMMAVWCTNCFAQQTQIEAFRKQLGTQADLVTVSLDVDPNEDLATLKAYVGKRGFDWAFAVAPPAAAQEIGRLYGDQFLNPSATPILIVDRHGAAHPLPFGIKSADDLMKAVKPYLDQGM